MSTCTHRCGDANPLLPSSPTLPAPSDLTAAPPHLPVVVRAATQPHTLPRDPCVTCHKTVTPATIHSPCCVNSTTCSGLGQPRCQLSPDLLGFKQNSSPTHFTLNSTAWAAPALNRPANRQLLTSWPSLPFLSSPPFSHGVKPSCADSALTGPVQPAADPATRPAAVSPHVGCSAAPSNSIQGWFHRKSFHTGLPACTPLTAQSPRHQ